MSEESRKAEQGRARQSTAEGGTQGRARQRERDTHERKGRNTQAQKSTKHHSYMQASQDSIG